MGTGVPGMLDASDVNPHHLERDCSTQWAVIPATDARQTNDRSITHIRVVY